MEAFYRKRKQLVNYLPQNERHKIQVRPRAQPGSAVNSPARTVISNENSLSESPVLPASAGGVGVVPGSAAGVGGGGAAAPAATGGHASAGKRRPSDPDSEADMSLGGDNSTMSSISEVTNGEQAQPPMKRSNTTNETPMNGNNGLEVS